MNYIDSFLSLWIGLIAFVVSKYTYSPFYIRLIYLSTFLLTTIILFYFLRRFFLTLKSIFPKKFIPWRIAVSKQWLINFRKNKHKYLPAQRFSFIRSVDCYLWEEIIMSCFEERGYPITRTPYSNDKGSDGFIKFYNNEIVIQAKLYSGAIHKQHVLDLEQFVYKHQSISHGLFIHSGTSSKPILDHVKNSTFLDMISGVDKILNFLDGFELYIFDKPLNPLPL